MRTSRLCSLWPDMRPLRFRRVPFGRDGTFDPGGATASRIAMPHILPSTVPSVSASATFFLSWLNPPPHPITVYASHPPSPTTAQHSLPGGALPPYRGRSFTGWNASASPDAPEPEVRFHLHPAGSRVRTRFPESWSPPTVRLQRHGLRYLGRFIAERDPLLRVGLRVRIRLPPAQSPGENPSPGIRLPPFQLFAEPRGQGSRPQRRVPVSRALRELVYCAATHPTHDHSTASSQCVLCLIFA